MKKVRFYFLYFFGFFIASLYSSSVFATCQFWTAETPNMLNHHFDFGNIVVPPNAPVGTVLASQAKGNNGDVHIYCQTGGTIHYWLNPPWVTSTSVDNTYATNIPGVGIRVGARGGDWWFSPIDGHPAIWDSYNNVHSGYVEFSIIKTGEVTSGGSLDTGFVGYIADDFGTHAVEVWLNNASISLPACNLNDGKPIDVDFGSAIATTDVASGKIERSIDYKLTCSYDNYGLKVRILGTGAAFNNDLLQTNINELGIKFKADGIDFPLNTEFNFASAAAKPVLKAILTQQAGSHLPAGDFTASATMRVEYQ
ncbi:fimbrial protein [Cronobacter sakazakii]|uniref:fimbrial protein n=1 Tax=Cronobacter sakazakii TaxID=28141 RepID=UPI000B3DACE3|nr:fimbrial protein [Cronobacter sakazakii]ELY3812782.1 fimbrial protein [Cronobacter sakazakii]PUW91097.1 MrfF [Cronobacter sakazakii]